VSKLAPKAAWFKRKAHQEVMRAIEGRVKELANSIAGLKYQKA
jgi:hypothetical protein